MAARGWTTSLLLAAAGASVGIVTWTRASRHAKSLRAFERFVADHGRVYSGREEWRQRFAIFEANLAYIEAENAKGRSYKLGVNAFADQTPQEFAQARLGLSVPPAGRPSRPWGGLPLLGTHRYSGRDLPAAVDWVERGAVTSPKNQAQCGSCWSFASTGALEGAWQIATGSLVSLSEQQLVDCSKNGNQGCKGGDMGLAFQYLENQSVCTEASYPYQAKEGACSQANCTVGIPSGGVQGYRDVDAKSAEALMEALAQQPVAVAIEADQMAFQLYSSGILTKECGAKLDHGVLAVGYGTENGVDYYKVKNSWGPGWGEQGYVRLTRAVPDDGECGIQDGPTYPVVRGPSARAPAGASRPGLAVVV